MGFSPEIVAVGTAGFAGCELHRRGVRRPCDELFRAGKAASIDALCGVLARGLTPGLGLVHHAGARLHAVRIACYWGIPWPAAAGQIGRAVQQECRDRSRMPSSA
eukprot:TRINITY_DN65421_c0_g1_i1.p2 TRINITY_DN65421_c0_g1~~TRINITY_DN65421_c0_g1_i1.p2  ORF type:complete len:105 (-),score=10.70 TRINITY_DN65421_c0_g1_i1:10-324(-)